MSAILRAPGWAFLVIALVATSLVGCDLVYPEVAVANKISDRILLKNPRFSGCVWNTVLANGEATSPGRCLPGADNVHFQKLDVGAYCQEQATDVTLAGLCPCDDGGVSSQDGDVDPGLVNTVPTWFNYQTISVKHVDDGQFRLFEITADDMEQDFSVPGPYGH